MGNEGVEDQRRHTAVTSQHGRLKARSESRGKHGIALDGEDRYDVRHGRLIITPDGTAKEDLHVANEVKPEKRIEQCSQLWLHNITFYGQVDAREKLILHLLSSSSSYSHFPRLCGVDVR